MTENDQIEITEALAEKPPKAPKAKTKAKSETKAKARSKTKSKPKSKTRDAGPKVVKPAEAAHDFDFVGKVESLLVKSGSGAEGFAFGLRGRHGKRQSFRLDPTDQFAMNAMAHLVLAAHASDTKIGVRTGPEVEGILIVRELECRPRIGKRG